MTPVDLIEALEKTGTGPDKLIVARDYVEQNPHASADAMTAALEAQGQGKDARILGVGWPPGTVLKAKKLLEGVPLSVLMGEPPSTSEESKERRLMKELFIGLKDYVGGQQDRQAEMQGRGVGNPKALRPAMARKEDE